MKTRERILVTSLELFNCNGEPNITTIDISNEMDISPGNLYYHFQGKEEIITELYLRYESEIVELLDSPSRHSLAIDDYWLYLHLIFETIHSYRFLYRDLLDLLAKNKKIKPRFTRVLIKKRKTFIEICEYLRDASYLIASDDEIAVLADNATVIATFWLNYEVMRTKKGYDTCYINQGIYQVICLVKPYMIDEQREILDKRSLIYKSSVSFPV
ncbi:TetR/AcrR family transcriptional regulator [Zooshikella harenae]|uniref:TetR/AcrR family transcriptional regulator n=1 Tax=Zooshikella harenae TaxID=2827238 RepID=A0ABS5ZFM0_9GAMM|nr:TetR/AcrR family transcriptional regulator [Zooshikella harenae]MBU2712853.1 TetR/AcrR family transcriptional regulator [Zooshikella harenae]